jgi:hypothetical protein
VAYIRLVNMVVAAEIMVEIMVEIMAETGIVGVATMIGTAVLGTTITAAMHAQILHLQKDIQMNAVYMAAVLIGATTGIVGVTATTGATTTADMGTMKDMEATREAITLDTQDSEVAADTSAEEVISVADTSAAIIGAAVSVTGAADGAADGAHGVVGVTGGVADAGHGGAANSRIPTGYVNSIPNTVWEEVECHL